MQDAVARNDPAAVAACLDAGETDACLRDGRRWSWLAEALRLGHVAAAQAFLDHPRGFGWESECWSVVGLVLGPRDDAAMLGVLLDRGAHLPYPEGDDTPLEHRLAESAHPVITNELFKRGSLRPRVLDQAGWVPLFRAVRAGDCTMAQVFFDHGASLNSRIEWRDRRSALHLALEATANREAMVRWLLSHGIDTRLVNDAGLTAAQQAARSGDAAMAGLIEGLKASGGPRWRREAVQRGINDVICTYCTRGQGFCFDPHDVVEPFLIGGDHDGAYPETPRNALSFVRQCDPTTELGRAVAPWAPVIERMLEGQDVGLGEILPLGRRMPRP